MANPTVRLYWGCTTFGCERGFYGTEETMPREWTHCPACGGELAEITLPSMRPAEATTRVSALSSDQPFVDPIRFLLDGLEVGSLAELREIVETLRWIAALDDDDPHGGEGDPAFYAGRGVAVDAAQEALHLPSSDGASG